MISGPTPSPASARMLYFLIMLLNISAFLPAIVLKKSSMSAKTLSIQQAHKARSLYKIETDL